MSIGNDNAATNLELSLGYSNHRISSSSSRSIGRGAGVNATKSRAEMTDPLSELVWSPHNGLSLKCADFSKSPPNFWDVGPSKLVASQASIGGLPPIITPYFGDIAGKSIDMDEVSSMGKALVADSDRKESSAIKEEGMLRENDKDYKDHKTVDFLSLRTEEPLLHEDKVLSMPTPIPISLSPEGKNKYPTFNTGKKNENKVDCSSSVLPLECTAENELPLAINTCKSEERFLRAKNPASRKIFLEREKGKEKVLSEGESTKTNSKEKDHSGESVESCGSVGLLSVVKKRGRFEQQLTVGTKRVKNQIQENPISMVGHRSSFMNWISNMVKGLNRIDKEKEPSLALTLENPKECHDGGDKKIVPYNIDSYQRGGSDMGFHTIFRSIYCHEPNEMEIEKDPMAESSPIRESRELVLAERTVGPDYADVAEGRNLSSSERKSANEVDNNKFNNPGNLWITRFSQKSHEHLANLNEKFEDKNKEISSFESNHVIPLSNVKNKGVIAFAKRLNALKHITSSDNISDSAQTTAICYYCGTGGHELNNCSEIKEKDRDNFVRNMKLYNEIREPHKCLCISCFEVDHWAISCPKRSIDVAFNSTFGDDLSKKEKLTFSCNSEEPKGIFDAIRKLRLSRMDINNWMNSGSSSSLDGYFLRLRLGKLESGQGGTGYYVAYITGEGRGKQPQGSKRPISVDIGGKSCLVESKFISNQDFLEDELTAWWSTTTKSGGTIPSGNELKVKLEERIRLEF